MDKSIEFDDPDVVDTNNIDGIEDTSTTTNDVLHEVNSKWKRTAPVWVWSSITEIQSEREKGVYSSKCNFCGHIFLMGDSDGTSNGVTFGIYFDDW